MATRSINQVILVGNLTRDPQLKYTPNGAAVATFGLATNSAWKNAQSETVQSTEFHNIVAWNKLAEICGQILKKGSKVYVTGSIKYRQYTDANGETKNRTEIKITDMLLLSGGKVSGDASGSYADEIPDDSQVPLSDADAIIEDVDDLPF